MAHSHFGAGWFGGAEVLTIDCVEGREIREIQRELGITTIFVTHDQEEALSISDRVVVMNQGRRIAEAKKSVIEIFDSGYTTPVLRKDIKVLGQSALGALYSGIHAMKTAKYATEHDSLVAKKLAYVMCGGDLSEPTLVSEQYLLDLEREAFLSLCGEKKTLERIQSVLKSGKPVRN